MAKKSSGVQRFRFVQDDSSHWHAIPADERAKFESWCLSFEDEAEEYTGVDFEQYRIDGYPGFYTFTDLQEDKD